MNSLLKPVLRSALVIGAALAFTSCETYPPGYGNAPVSDPGGYVDGGPAYYGGGGGYASRPYYGSGYGGGYYSADYYRRNGGRYDRNDYDHRYDHYDNRNDHRNDHDDHRNDNDHRKSSSDNDIRLTKYREGGKPSDLPDGYHSKDWYQQRGYSLSKNNYETRDGDPRGHANDDKKGKSKDSDDKGNKKH